MNQVQPTGMKYGILCFFILMMLIQIVLFRYSGQRKKDSEAATAVSASAAASAKLSALEKETWEKARVEKAEADFRAAKELAFRQCRNQHDIPVMGFGFKVVCVKSEAVSWEQKLEEGQPPPW